MSDAIKKQDEEERRSLQKYIFELEEIQKRAEQLSHEHEQLKHTKNLLMAILSRTIHGICLLRDCRFVWYNKAFSDIFGCNQEELIGKTTRALFPSTEEYIKACKVTYNKLHPSELIVYEYEYAHKKGHRVPCLVTGRALDENDLSKGHVFSFTDFTERKRSREALKQAYQGLQDTQVQLIQSGKLGSIGELVSGVAHELNQPLMVIRGNAQLIKRSIGKSDLKDDELAVQMEVIEKNTGRMMKIINHLQAFSCQSGKIFSSVGVNKIINDSFLMVGEQFRILKIEVKKDLSDDLAQIMGDANQLEQVILNLLANAKDAIMENRQNSEGKGQKAEYIGKLQIITSAKFPVPGTGQYFVEILFRDNGCGISDQSLEKIFDPFFTTKKVGKGTGLGLSISYGIIKEHGGEIEVAETGPDGTTFRVKLPSIEK